MAKEYAMRSPVFEALCDAGLADNDTRRVVLDFQVGDVMTAYIERYADQRVLKVITSLEGVQITREEVADHG